MMDRLHEAPAVLHEDFPNALPAMFPDFWESNEMTLAKQVDEAMRELEPSSALALIMSRLREVCTVKI